MDFIAFAVSDRANCSAWFKFETSRASEDDERCSEQRESGAHVVRPNARLRIRDVVAAELVPALRPTPNLKFAVNRQQRITACGRRVVVAHETILRADLNVTATSVAVNQDRADWRLVGIADRQSSKAVIVQ